MQTSLSQDYLTIIKEERNRFDLDLSGMTVLTEAASGFYSCTPLIAAIAGADVIAFGRDSKFGEFDNISSNLLELARQLDVKDKIKIIDSFDKLGEVDILTNAGMLRPIRSDLLSKLGPNGVLSYMCENWEVREGDVDLNYCNRNNIPVLFTDESKQGADMFHFCGQLALTLCQEANVDLKSASVLIISADRFGVVIQEALKEAGAKVILHSDPGLPLPTDQKFDAIVIAEYQCTDVLIGNIIKTETIKQILTQTGTLIQFAGANDLEQLYSNKITVYPPEQLSPQRMARTLSHFGALPVVRLQTAGLKVGQVGVEAKKLNLTGDNFDNYILNNSPAQLPLGETV